MSNGVSNRSKGAFRKLEYAGAVTLWSSVTPAFTGTALDLCGERCGIHKRLEQRLLDENLYPWLNHCLRRLFIIYEDRVVELESGGEVEITTYLHVPEPDRWLFYNGWPREHYWRGEVSTADPRVSQWDLIRLAEWMRGKLAGECPVRLK